MRVGGDPPDKKIMCHVVASIMCQKIWSKARKADKK